MTKLKICNNGSSPDRSGHQKGLNSNIYSPTQHNTCFWVPQQNYTDDIPFIINKLDVYFLNICEAIPVIHNSTFSIHNYSLLSIWGYTNVRITTIDNARKNSDYFKAIYNKQKKKGKHHYVALSHVMRKLVIIALAVIKTGEPFDEKKLNLELAIT